MKLQSELKMSMLLTVRVNQRHVDSHLPDI
jgi:hypothetical protein